MFDLSIFETKEQNFKFRIKLLTKFFFKVIHTIPELQLGPDFDVSTVFNLKLYDNYFNVSVINNSQNLTKRTAWNQYLV